MKDFWKIVGGSALGAVLSLVIVALIMGISVTRCVKAMIPEQRVITNVTSNGVLEIDMSSLIITEQQIDPTPLEAIQELQGGVQMQRIDILKAVQAIDHAAANPAVKYIYLRADAQTSITNIEEIREALQRFRDSGKAVIAYMETPSNASYYLASVADMIYMSKYHGGMNQLIGLSGQMIFIKDLLDFLGVKMQLIRHGKYKSAGEMYIRSNASAENLEQNAQMIKSIWGDMVAQMCKKSGMSEEEFNSMIDNLELTSPDVFLEKKLVDELVDRQEMLEKLCKYSGVDSADQIPVISLADYAAVNLVPDYRTENKVAIIYADGEIVDGYGESEVAGKRFAQVIDNVAADNSIKAVVLRVNSPGGSVIAASQIKTALDNLHKKKPIVASYGSYAASGGYWISACSDYIYSDATTLTGSIGVFGLIPDFSGAVSKWGKTNITAVPSNKHSDMYSLMRPLKNEEVQFIQKDIENVYTEFTNLVASGRKMDVARVDELGQGRVWTGTDALANGLVDEIGGISDAVSYAALLGDCRSYIIESYPQIPTVEEQIRQLLQPTQENYLVKIASKFDKLDKVEIFARIPYEIEIR